MEDNASLIEPLLERTQQYYKTSFKLLKLKSVEKTADVTSSVVSRLLLIFVLTISVLFLNTAIAIWLGDLLGESYYGFLVISSFYSFIGIVLYFIHSSIKGRINNLIISKMLN